MLKKHKVLLSVIQEFGGKIDNEKLNILLFIYSNEFNAKKLFSFINVNKSPFSPTLLEDKKYLISKNFLKNEDGWEIESNKKRFIFELDMFERADIQSLKNDFANKNESELRNYLYSKYNDFFLETIESVSSQMTLYTIGYEDSSVEEYINKLVKEKVKVLCDVRKNAYSQKFGFSKNEIQKNLGIVGIEYIHIPNLGIESENRKNLENKLDYFILFQKYIKTLPQKINDINLLIELLKKHYNIAITCFEKDYKMCHRSKIAEFLKSNKELEVNVVNL